MHYLVGTAALLPPLIAFALRQEWGIAVGFAFGLDLDDDGRKLIVEDLVHELERTGGDRAWRTSAT